MVINPDMHMYMPSCYAIASNPFILQINFVHNIW
jgi:hypothetical protein